MAGLVKGMVKGPHVGCSAACGRRVLHARARRAVDHISDLRGRHAEMTAAAAAAAAMPAAVRRALVLRRVQMHIWRLAAREAAMSVMRLRRRWCKGCSDGYVRLLLQWWWWEATTGGWREACGVARGCGGGGTRLPRRWPGCSTRLRRRWHEAAAAVA